MGLFNEIVAYVLYVLDTIAILLEAWYSAMEFA